MLNEQWHATEDGSYIFLANLYLKQGISAEYVMVDFICEDLLELWLPRTDNNKMKYSCPHYDSNPVPSAYEANALTIAQLDLISIEHLKVYRILPACAIEIYLYHVVCVVKCFVYYILLTLYSQQTSELVK